MACGGAPFPTLRACCVARHLDREVFVARMCHAVRDNALLAEIPRRRSFPQGPSSVPFHGRWLILPADSSLGRVAAVRALLTACMIFCVQFLYVYFIEGLADYANLLQIHWSVLPPFPFIFSYLSWANVKSAGFSPRPCCDSSRW
ncbi:hypothetical protein C8Q78DRAFT_289400 [Trametes maxima]|nr:hypothetical protein C8Q78DRAFT_289400 [Trametes maxima]